MRRISTLGNQFAEVGVGEFPGRRPRDIASATIDAIVGNVVPASVKLVLYNGKFRSDGSKFVQVYMVDGDANLTLPGTEIMPGETWEASAARLCRDYLGFEPAPCTERFSVLSPVMVQLERAVRGTVRPAQTVIIPLAYELVSEELARLRLNTQSNGEPSPLVERYGEMRPRFSDGGYRDLLAFAESANAPEPLGAILRQCKRDVIDRKTMWAVATLGRCTPPT